MTKLCQFNLLWPAKQRLKKYMFVKKHLQCNNKAAFLQFDADTMEPHKEAVWYTQRVFWGVGGGVMDSWRCAGQIYETAAELKRGSLALLQCCGPSVWCYCLLRQHFTLTSKLHDPSHSLAMQPPAMPNHILHHYTLYIFVLFCFIGKSTFKSFPVHFFGR